VSDHTHRWVDTGDWTERCMACGEYRETPTGQGRLGSRGLLVPAGETSPEAKALAVAMSRLLMAIQSIYVVSEQIQPALDAADVLYEAARALLPKPPPCTHPSIYVTRMGLLWPPGSPQTSRAHCGDCKAEVSMDVVRERLERVEAPACKCGRPFCRECN
jgi:hypothetical protein